MRLLIILSVLVLNGCVIAVNTDDWEDKDGWHARQKHNARAIENLVIGETQASIRKELGRPDFNESFVRHGTTYTVLYYRTRHTDSDGDTTKDETTPLVFVAGELVGWGDSAVEYAVEE